MSRECVVLNMHAMATPIFHNSYRVPTFQDRVDDGCEGASVYALHRRQLQHLQWRCPGERWVLKSGDHMGALDRLLETYPDACVVATHCDPVKVAASFASLATPVRSMASDAVDAREVAADWTPRLAKVLDRATAVRDSGRFAPERFYDMHFSELLKDPMGVVERICDHFGLALRGEAADAMRAFVADNPQGKHGVHRYRPSEYGLDPEREWARFARYVERHGIEPETAGGRPERNGTCWARYRCPVARLGSTRPGALALGVATGVAALAVGCTSYDVDYPRPAAVAVAGPSTTTLGALFAADAAAHPPAHSGVSYVRYGREALEARLALADLAESSLDLQYYIWDADVSGRLLAERLVRAADRGVRVRVLLDDVSVAGRDLAIAQLSGHPKISIRAFNPFRDRSRWRDLFTEPSRVNRRSHNKVFVADRSIALVGGRNIADHYFGFDAESNYRDLDAVAVGAVVQDVSAVFEEFWNSEYAVPYAAFVDEPPTPQSAERAAAAMRERMAAEPAPYPIEENVAALGNELHSLRDRLVWAPVRVLHDDPSKAKDRSVRGIVDELRALTSEAEREVLIENAYFVPRERTLEIASALCERGVRVRVLTNSLVSNDVAAIHSGYRGYRDDLLEIGVEIYELRPDSAMKERWSILSTESRSGLHTKAMVVDREHVVIGSYNLDPRSADINSEIALLVDSPEFGRQVGEFLDGGVQPENSFRVTLEDGDLVWRTQIDGEEVEYDVEPESAWWQRWIVGVLGILPIRSQL